MIPGHERTKITKGWLDWCAWKSNKTRSWHVQINASFLFCCFFKLIVPNKTRKIYLDFPSFSADKVYAQGCTLGSHKERNTGDALVNFLLFSHVNKALHLLLHLSVEPHANAESASWEHQHHRNKNCLVLSREAMNFDESSWVIHSYFKTRILILCFLNNAYI